MLVPSAVSEELKQTHKRTDRHTEGIVLYILDAELFTSIGMTVSRFVESLYTLAFNLQLFVAFKQ